MTSTESRPTPNGHTLALLFASGLLLASCASASECDPNAVGNVLQSFGCNVGGGFDAHLEEQRTELAAVVEETELTEAETARIEADAERYATDREAWQRKMQQLDAQLALLQLDVIQTEASNAEEEAMLQALREELDETQRRLSVAQAQTTPVDPAEITQLQTDIAERKKAITEILETIVAE